MVGELAEATQLVLEIYGVIQKFFNSISSEIISNRCGLSAISTYGKALWLYLMVRNYILLEAWINMKGDYEISGIALTPGETQVISWRLLVKLWSNVRLRGEELTVRISTAWLLVTFSKHVFLLISQQAQYWTNLLRNSMSFCFQDWVANWIWKIKCLHRLHTVRRCKLW